MTLSMTPLFRDLGLLVDGVTIGEELDDDVVTQLRHGLHTAGLLLFKNQDVDEAQQVRFARYFGDLSRQGGVHGTMSGAVYVSNSRSDGILGTTELHLHADQCYYRYPQKALMLYGLEVPEQGGETLFVNTATALDRLDRDVRGRLVGARVRHEFDYGSRSYGTDAQVRRFVAEADHPAVAPHPWSTAEVLLINKETAKELVGFPSEESRVILDHVNDVLADPAHLYRHRWARGDLVVWDNLLLQHARTPFAAAARRTLRRCAIAHECEGQNAPSASLLGNR